MKALELIHRLAQYPPDTEFFFLGEHCCTEVNDIVDIEYDADKKVACLKCSINDPGYGMWSAINTEELLNKR